MARDRRQDRARAPGGLPTNAWPTTGGYLLEQRWPQGHTQAFDGYIEVQGFSFYADTHRGLHLTPGAYVRLRVVRGLAGIDSKRGIVCRPAVALARRSCLGLGLSETLRVHAMNLENAAPASSGYPSCDLLHGNPAGASAFFMMLW